jgi:hypothetical protein
MLKSYQTEALNLMLELVTNYPAVFSAEDHYHWMQDLRGSGHWSYLADGSICEKAHKTIKSCKKYISPELMNKADAMLATYLKEEHGEGQEESDENS